MHEIIIPGKPIAKNRPRFARRGKGVVAYSNQETEEGRTMNFIRASFGATPLDGPLTLEAEFFFEPPASVSKKRRAAMLSGEEPCLNPKDVDNLLKFLMDASNGILWHDDHQVVRISGFKAYAEHAKTVLRIGPAYYRCTFTNDRLSIPQPSFEPEETIPAF